MVEVRIDRGSCSTFTLLQHTRKVIDLRPIHAVTARHGPLDRSTNMAMPSGRHVGLDSTDLNPRRAGEHAAAKKVIASQPTLR